MINAKRSVNYRAIAAEAPKPYSGVMAFSLLELVIKVVQFPLAKVRSQN